MSEGVPVARNAPCPCGSGRKYKRCCGRDAPSQWSGSSLWHRMRRAEARFVTEIGDWATERFGPAILSVAWWDFLADADATWEDAPDEHPEFQQLFVPWALFGWVAGEDEPEDWPREPLALAYLTEAWERLDALERRFLAAACARPCSFLQVHSVEPGQSLHVRDVLTGEEWTVRERTATGSLERGAILFARVVSLDDTAILCGAGLQVIPPSELWTLLELREELAEGPGPLDPDDLEVFEADLRLAYFELVHAVLDPAPPVLTNSDGDLLAQVELSYALGCAPRDAFDALRDLAPGTRKRDLLDEAEHDDRGEIRAVELPWLRRGSKLNPAMENTVLGRIRIRDSQLTVEVNSRKRATRVRRLVERRLGDAATFERERVQTLEELREAAAAAEETEEGRQRRAEHERLQNAPEVRALTERMRAEHWQRWLDEEIPALGGRTPRDAARDPRGRERLAALLLEFEWQGAQADAENPMAPDVDALRRELGLA